MGKQPFITFLDHTYFFSDKFCGPSSLMVIRWPAFIDGIMMYYKLIPFSDSVDFKEEEEWVLADDTEWPFSFLRLCEAFGIEPDSLRKALTALKGQGCEYKR